MSILKRLVINNFRNYQLKSFGFSPQTTLIIGSNAVGKTSLVEAVSLLSMGDSFRAGKIEEMIKFDQELGRVQGKIVAPEEIDLEIVLTRGLVQGKRTHRRLFSVNGVRKRKKDFINKFFIAVFRPEDMRLVEGSKNRRRKFMDEILSSLDWQYAHALKTYGEALVKRNKLLWQIKERLVSETVLSYWNMTLVKHGEYLQKKRHNLLGVFSSEGYPLKFSIEYQPSTISSIKQKQYQKKSIAAGHSLIGPHKDDFVINLLGKNGQQNNIAIYGSRGQQRMAVLWLKLSGLMFLEEQSEEKAILILDDILSELDSNMRERVLNLLSGRQSIITSADERVFLEIKNKTKNLELIKLKDHDQ